MSRRGGMTLTGAGELIAALTSMSRVIAPLSAFELRELSEEIKDGSIDRAPEKTGRLVDSHFVEQTGRGRDATFHIGFPEVLNDEGKDYGMLMHEGLDGEGKSYNLGQKSADKNTGRAHYGEGVGMKFLARSFESNYRKMLKLSQDVLLKTLRAAARARRRG